MEPLAALTGNRVSVVNRDEAALDRSHQLGATYRVVLSDVSPQLFFNIRNVLNTDPVPFANSIYATNASASYYDVLGRVFRVGVRFQM